jgi:hypothetical protein
MWRICAVKVRRVAACRLPITIAIDENDNDAFNKNVDLLMAESMLP